MNQNLNYLQISPHIKIAYVILNCSEPKYLPLVLIQGLTGVKEDWLGLDKEMSKDRDVLIFDNRGIGESSVPPGPYSIKRLALDTIELINSIGWKKVDLMGISMGGMIAQTVTLKAPSLINKLILGCTTSNATTLQPNVESPLSGNGVKKTKREITESFLSTCFTPEYKLNNPKKFNDLIDHVLQYKRSPKGVMSQFAGILMFNTSNEISNINCKTLIIHGDTDKLISCEKGIAISKKIKNSKLIILKNCGHNFWMSDLPTTVNYLTAFLNNDSSL